MTNFEWAMQNDAETVKMVKDILANEIAVVDGKITKCSRTDCSKCKFGGNLCVSSTREWLDAEHEEEKTAPKVL